MQRVLFCSDKRSVVSRGRPRTGRAIVHDARYCVISCLGLVMVSPLLDCSSIA